MAITGLGNLAIKVADLDEAMAFYRGVGADVDGPLRWNGADKAEVHLAGTRITLFTVAVYDDEVPTPTEGFLHAAFLCDDLDAAMEGHDVVWGPQVVEGDFGRRRIVFVNGPGGVRLEWMEQLEDPA